MLRPKVLLCILLISLPPIVPRSGYSYHWPLGAPPALTSTFAEHRSGHLHAGVDLKTWGREGYQVYAVADGSVWRVQTSPWGYGQVLYLRLTDGRTAVYGHLSSFAPAIQAVVEAEQERQGCYSVNIYPPPGQMPVRQGEVVAYSGRSGCAYPHLHFELRDEQNRPLNPILHGFTVSDTKAPRLVSLSIKPLGWDAWVDGRSQEHIIPLQWQAGSGCFTLASVPHVEGRAGLALAVHDLADGAQNRLNVYALEMWVDGRSVFSTRYDFFPFESTNLIDLDTDFDLYRRGRGIYQNLYIAAGNDLPFYRPARPGAGIIDVAALGSGLHHIRIQAEDGSGNASQAEFTLLLDERPSVDEVDVTENSLGLEVALRVSDPDDDPVRVWAEISSDLGESWISRPAVRESDGGTLHRARFEKVSAAVILVRAWAEDGFGVRSYPRMRAFGTLPGLQGEPRFEWSMTFHGDFVELLVSSDRVLQELPRMLFNRPGDGPRSVILQAQGLRQYRGRCPLMGGPDGQAVITVTGRDLGGHLGVDALTLPVNTITRGQGGRVGDLSAGIIADFPPRGVYEAFAARFEKTGAASPPGLPMISQAFTLYPQDRVFDQPATVWLSVLPGQEKNLRIGVYRLSRSGNWSFAGRLTREDAAALGARVKSFSTFALLEDQVEPLIWQLKPADGARLSDRRPVLSAKVRDTGSGIGDEKNIVLMLDGRPVISRYDPPVEMIFYQPKNPLPVGEHVVELMVSDQAGNRSQSSSCFRIVP